MRRIILYVLVIAITLMALILAWQFSLSFVLFALSLAVSSALKPSITHVATGLKSRPLALVLVYSAFIGLILVILLFGGQLLLQDLQTAGNDFVRAYNHIKTYWPIDGALFQQALAEQLPSSNELFQAFLSEEGFVTLTQEGGAGQGIFSYLGYAAIIIVLSLYWSADQVRFERLGVSLFPVERRPKALHIWRMVEGGVGAYLRSEFIQSVLAGLVLGVGYWMIGLKYPALLAAWAAIARLIPWFGTLVAIIPFLFIGGFLSFSVLLALLFTILVIVYLKALIEPRVLERRSDNSLLIVLFVIVLWEAYGLIGVLLAPPLATAVQIIMRELYPLFARRYKRELEALIKLRRRLFQLRTEIKDSASSETMQYMNQLQELANQSITYLQKY
ncbi:MAG TPA: AI-2E family transporter [Anaerolineales bacterium]|nr:AI-2E family transporter [Anaerolineales bacterium]